VHPTRGLETVVNFCKDGNEHIGNKNTGNSGLAKWLWLPRNISVLWCSLLAVLFIAIIFIDAVKLCHVINTVHDYKLFDSGHNCVLKKE
jgi:hypothetical protein